MLEKHTLGKAGWGMVWKVCKSGCGESRKQGGVNEMEYTEHLA